MKLAKKLTKEVNLLSSIMFYKEDVFDELKQRFKKQISHIYAFYGLAYDKTLRSLNIKFFTVIIKLDHVEASFLLANDVAP